MRYSFLFFLIFTTSLTVGQHYTSTNKKAIKKFDEAVHAYANRNEQKALELAEDAVKKDPEFAEAYYLMADIYGMFREYDARLDVLKKGVKYKPYTLGYLNLGKTELYLGQYQNAKNSILSAIKLDKKQEFKERLLQLAAQAEFGVQAVAHPVKFEPENLGENINSEFDDYLPSLSLDESELIFTRAVLRKGHETIYSMNDTQEDFYISRKNEQNNWMKAQAVGSPVNTEFNEGAQFLSPDGRILFFTSCQNNGKDSPHGKSYGSCDIFYSVKLENGWSEAQNAGKGVNTPYWESQPSFSANGKTLYFVSNRPGGEGESDIWTCTMQEDGTWSRAENLGKMINTKGKEQSPFIHPDNQTLYFSSNGHLGMGQSDLFMSRRDTNGNWTKPVNLGYPINTHKEQFSLIINAKGDKAYFAADAEGGYGRLDLYSFDLPEKFRPVPTTYLKGIVFDAETHKNLEARFELIEIEADSLISASTSNPENGSFMLSLPIGKDYALNVSKEGYLFYSDNFSLKINPDSVDFYELKIPLQPIKKGYKIVLENIFFDTDKSELRPESVVELSKLYDFLRQNPTLKVEIGGHTDDVGSISHNLQLSKARAKSVYDYLITKGISADRLTYKGYGSSQPRAENNSSENRQKNRRTVCKIVG